MKRLAFPLVALCVLAGTDLPAASGEAGQRATADAPSERRIHDARDAAGADRAARTLSPVTHGMRQPAPERPLAQPQRLALAPVNAAAAAKSMTALSGASAKAQVVIDVIVAYTRAAASYYHDIEPDLVALSIEVANESFRLSKLGHITLRLVHAYQTDYVERGGVHFDHVWRFADKGDGHMDEIHALRDRYRADAAILIVDDASGCGLTTRVQPDAEEAFAVVHHECAAASYTVAHEVGHIIGARHEFGYVNGTKWRDIMAYKESCGGCPRVPVWSNPTVLVSGEPAGTTQLNNARIIAEQASRVAAFR
ncbi:MAG: M12 family metallo-peptidase [Hyphomicrobiaceae bacterium]